MKKVILLVLFIVVALVIYFHPLMFKSETIDRITTASHNAHVMLESFRGTTDHIGKDICPICNPATYKINANNKYWKVEILETEDNYR